MLMMDSILTYFSISVMMIMMIKTITMTLMVMILKGWMRKEQKEKEIREKNQDFDYTKVNLKRRKVIGVVADEENEDHHYLIKREIPI